jgi:catechol 2,3-dioxygenase-like lactoylglutathione lyase family enzyme
LIAIGPVHHVGFVVREFSPAEAYFKELGYERLSSPVRDDYQQADVVFMHRQGSAVAEPLLELIQPVSPDSKVYSHAFEGRLQIHHLCYRVADLSQALAGLKRSGFAQVQRVAEAPAIGGSLIAFVYAQPTGLFELVESPPF